MALLRVAGFDGVVPRLSATALRDNQAQQADNVKLYNGELRYWRGARLEHTPGISTGRSIYKHVNAAGASRWLVWTTDVDVVPGPSADQTDVRLYYTGDTTPRKTNYTLTSTADYQEMGLPAPTTAPTLAETTGTNPATETRVYIYTYVNTFGSLIEESAPSPASTVFTVAASKAVTISGFAAPPAGKYNWTHIRIYRSTSAGSGANYAFVAEIPLATTSYTDDLRADALGSAIQTIGWAPPPSGLKGIVSMAGGVLAGFVGNTVYFSEPYYPHAWPIRYSLNVPHQIVGLGAIGSTLVVVTDLFPYVITGINPGAMSVEKIPVPEPCVSKRSIAVDETGVMYASPNGLVSIGRGAQGVVTHNLFRRDEWQEYAPNTLVGTIFEGRYFGFFQSPAEGNRCLILTRDDTPALAFFDAAALGAHVDARNAKLYYIALSNGKIYEADADDAIPFNYQWMSKRFVLPAATSFSAIKVDADYKAAQAISTYNQQVTALQTANQALWAANPNLGGTLNQSLVNARSLNGSILNDLPTLASERSVQVFVYADGNLVAQPTLTSFDPVRLPSFRCREVEVKLFGNTPVRSVAMATTVLELRG
jgi:hypothetical protein